MNERDELADLIWDMAIRHLGVATSSGKSMADELIEAGYRKLEPVWAEGLENDGEYEYTISSDCDGSNVKHWKRRPEMVVTEEPSAWEPR